MGKNEVRNADNGGQLGTIELTIKEAEKGMSSKHVLFCYKLSEFGGNKAKAYEAVYGKTKQAKTMASRLFAKNDKVRNLYYLLMEQTQQNSLLTKEGMLKKIIQLTEKATEIQVFYDNVGNRKQQFINGGLASKMIEEINKMMGFHAPVETKNTTKIEMPETKTKTSYLKFLKKENKHVSTATV